MVPGGQHVVKLLAKAKVRSEPVVLQRSILACAAARAFAGLLGLRGGQARCLIRTKLSAIFTIQAVWVNVFRD